MAGILLKDQVDLISIMVPLEVIAKEKKYIYIHIILECAFGYSIIMARPRHECERGCAALVEHIYVFFLSLYILEEISLILCLNELTLFADFKSEAGAKASPPTFFERLRWRYELLL